MSSPALRRTVRSYARALVKDHALAAEALRHDDRMLTWLIALTGAAIFALPAHVAAVCGTDRLSVVIPGVAAIPGVAGVWTVSVVLGLAARIAGLRYRETGDRLFLTKWGGLQEFIIGVGDDTDRLLAIVNDQGGVGTRKAEVRRHRCWFHGLYIGALVAAAVGATLLLWQVATC